MENWQLTFIILGSVLIGAFIPAMIMLSLALYRAGKEIVDIGKELEPTLKDIHIILNRTEVLSRGLEGGEVRIADFLRVMGELTNGIERNMKFINISTTVMSSAWPAVSAFIQTMRQSNESAPSVSPSRNANTANDASVSAPLESKEEVTNENNN